MQRAAEQGHKEALCEMGHRYVAGDGVERNIEKGIKWYKQAIKCSCVNAMYSLGLLYASSMPIYLLYPFTLKLFHIRRFYKGEDIGCNYRKAFKFFLQAARANDVDAAYKVSFCRANSY